MTRYCMAVAVLCLPPVGALASNVSVAGIFPGKALLVVEGGAPQTVALGQRTADGVRVVAIEGEVVTLEIDGQKRQLRVGQNVVSQKSSGDRQQTTLAADTQGHFFSTGEVNGRTVRFLVDTGASMVSMGAADAARIGVDWRKGQAGISNTANGQVRVWKVKFDTVRVGDVTLHGVDGLVHETDLPIVLLGMSFLSRMEIRNEGSTMTLKKRF